ncbi:hypothetical protein [Kushneria aurantia]|uniref:Uncharacterized protein n=1 Tax=Kushneria aurantia TaxID=504092 RepID=A0ABV6G506_9GAMM|nr:hypothetical protein [Kushneria aurantia]
MDLLLTAPLGAMAAICLVMVWNQRRENRGKPSLTDRAIDWIARIIA